jgi:hypothetical protein
VRGFGAGGRVEDGERRDERESSYFGLFVGDGSMLMVVKR